MTWNRALRATDGARRFTVGPRGFMHDARSRSGCSELQAGGERCSGPFSGVWGLGWTSGSDGGQWLHEPGVLEVGNRFEIRSVSLAALETERTHEGDHGGVVGAEPRARQEHG